MDAFVFTTSYNNDDDDSLVKYSLYVFACEGYHKICLCLVMLKINSVELTGKTAKRCR